MAGGGPAGSSTANLLRQKGRSVLLLLEREKSTLPRGRTLLPYSNDVWQELGVLDVMIERYQHKPGARFIHEESGAHFTYYFDTAIRPGPSYAFHVKRAEFDQMLLEYARTIGVEVHEETRVTDADFSPDGASWFERRA